MIQKLLTLACLLTTLFMHSAAFAQSSVADDVVTRLQSDGYTVTEVRRSWLGRIVITANSGNDEREVVLNRTSGEILRDQTFKGERGSNSEPEAVPKSKGGDRGSSSSPDSDKNGKGGGGHGGKGGGGHGGKG